MNKNKQFIFRDLLDNFDVVTLKELDRVKLLKRHDTKFIFNHSELIEIINQIKPFYKILRIENCSTFKYYNTYFDTNDFIFYQQHHNQSRNRFKVRLRKYSSSDNPFFEIKIKNNKEQTIKKRWLIESENKSIGEYEQKMVSEIIGISPNQLKPVLEVQFSRITLTDKKFNERLTIDTNLCVSNKTKNKSFDQLVVSEIKQQKYNTKSDFIEIVRKLKIPETRFSKYCIGLINVNHQIKYNRFKPKLLELNKFSAGV